MFGFVYLPDNKKFRGCSCYKLAVLARQYTVLGIFAAYQLIPDSCRTVNNFYAFTTLRNKLMKDLKECEFIIKYINFVINIRLKCVKTCKQKMNNPEELFVIEKVHFKL